jgi:hypothetical protein
MKAPKPLSAGLACVMVVLVLAGCDTTGGGGGGPTGNMKTQGVYTTLALTNHPFDMPASAYVPRNSFGPDEHAAAVIVGYGEWNQQQQVRLELIESRTGRTMLSHDDYASYGKALVYRLPIRLTGSYELRLSSGGTPLDNWVFTVTRISGTVPDPAGKYAEGVFGVSMDSADLSASFEEYDTKLIHVVNAAVRHAAGSTNADLFAQRFPGSVVIQFRLDSQGRLTDPKVVGNTLDDACAEVFKKALLDRSPYPAWPEDARQALGADYRNISMTITYE